MSHNQLSRPPSRASGSQERLPRRKREAEGAAQEAMPRELERWIALAASRARDLLGGGLELRFYSDRDAGGVRIELRDARTGRLMRLIAPEEAVEIALGAPVGLRTYGTSEEL